LASPSLRSREGLRAIRLLGQPHEARDPAQPGQADADAHDREDRVVEVWEEATIELDCEQYPGRKDAHEGRWWEGVLRAVVTIDFPRNRQALEKVRDCADAVDAHVFDEKNRRQAEKRVSRILGHEPALRRRFVFLFLACFWIPPAHRAWRFERGEHVDEEDIDESSMKEKHGTHCSEGDWHLHGVCDLETHCER